MKKDLHKTLAKVAEDISLLSETVGDATQLFAEGKLPQADLTKCISDRDALQAIHASLVIQIQAEAARDVVAEHQAQVDHRAAAAKEAKAILAERAECAADLDSCINSLVNTALRFEMVNDRLNEAAYSARVDADARRHLLNLRAVGAVLADRLLQSGLVAKLDSIHVPGNQHTGGKSVTDLIARGNEKMAAFIDAARKKDA